ncbi:MAG: hypothetical protein JXQ68_07215 [Campylobacterales bacterium]|nr:hypothetical protein [Campylobacterales bacterium]
MAPTANINEAIEAMKDMVLKIPIVFSPTVFTARAVTSASVINVSILLS